MGIINYSLELGLILDYFLNKMTILKIFSKIKNKIVMEVYLSKGQFGNIVYYIVKITNCKKNLLNIL